MGIDNERLYKLLEVEKTASRNEIRKAHQKMDRLHHPDRGGDPEQFKEIQSAYEILNDPEKRRTYDETGETEPRHDRDPFSFFRPQEKRRARTKNVVTPLKVTLEQLYSGITKKMAVNRKVVDQAEGVSTCEACNGRGVRVQVSQSGMFRQQMQVACDRCSGAGKAFKHVKQREVLEVHVQKGAVDGQKLVFHEKAMNNQTPILEM
jgi:DnaJ family protein A protein 2